MSFTPGVRLGPYEIISVIGSGGMGDVYKARDTRLGRLVAIKVLSGDAMGTSEGRLRLSREAHAVAALSHPNICTLYDFSSGNGIDYLVMEYVEGATLAERLMAGPLPLAEVLRYSIDIADALEHAHRRGFVHRDLKPGNVMVTRSGAVLLDFGLAKSVFTGATSRATKVADTQDFTGVETLKGTLPYMAPEQLEGRAADARSDIFAFGVLLFEMVTGHKPFDGPSHAAVIAAILSSDPRAMTEWQPLVPPSLQRIVQKCLAKDPDERWQSPHDLKTMLRWISESEWPSFRPSSRSASVSRRELIAWTGAVGVLLVTILAIVANRGGPDRPRAGRDATPVVFPVGPPENAALFAGGGVMAVSPDGRHLALVATPTGGRPLLWIRSLSAAAARPLVSTVGASQPFWSPDSRFVGFIADGKLKKVDVTTGEVQTLCDARGTTGTWSRTGIILFKSDVSGGIERVSADSGPASAVVGLDSSRGERYLNWPQFLPDGRHFLYMMIGTQPDSTGIYAAALDGLQRTRVLADESQAIYISPGYLVFRRDATVFAQRFDAASLELIGDAFPLVENVAFNFGTRRGVFSASDTGVLAYRTTEDSVLGWFDRRGTSLSTIEPAGRYRDPAISPDGRRIAVAKLDRRLGTDDIWLIDAARGLATQFTFDPGRDRAAVWSPEGDRLAFASRRGVKEDIYVKSATGQSSEQLLFSPMRAVHPVDWSRDGEFVIFVQPGEHTHFDLWALPLMHERKPFAVLDTAANEHTGQLSPDGRWLAYDSNESGVFEVYVKPFPDPSEQKWKISDRGGIEPKWRHDGNELFYLGADQRLMAVTVRTGSSFARETPRALFETAAVGTHLGTIGRNQYDVARDGERFLINAPGRGSSEPITVVLNWPAMLSR